MTDAPEPQADRSTTRTPAAARAAIAFALLALGMVTARAVPAVPPVVWFATCAAAGASAAFFRARACIAALIIAAFALGAAVFAARINHPAPDPLVDLLNPAPGDAGPGPPIVLTVEGLALDSPRPPPADSLLSPFASTPPTGTFSLHARRVLTDSGWADCDSVLWCRVPGTAYSSAQGLTGFGVRAGQSVRLTGLAEPVRALDNPGSADARAWAAQSNVAGSLRVEFPDLVIVNPAALRTWRAALAEVTDALHARALRALDPGPGAAGAPRALILSLFLGQSEPGERDLRAAFTRLGLAHVLAISGVHVIVMAGVALFLIRLTGDRGALEPLAVAALVILYLLAVPASAPVIRAGVMTLALLAAEALGRRHDRLAVIAWCAAGLILWRPLDLWTLGFQLSLGLTALLLWLGGHVHDRIFGPDIRGLIPTRRTLARQALSGAKRALSASILCWTASAPLIAWRTGLLSPLAVLTSLITLPAITLLMWAGYLTFIVGLVHPAAARPLHPALLALASACVHLVDWLDKAPLVTLRAPPIGTAWMIAATLLVLAWFVRGRLRDRVCLAALAVLALWFGVERFTARSGDSRLRVDALAAGDGACTLLRQGADSILWNCGSSRLTLGERTLPVALRQLGAWRIHTVVLTAPDLRHLSALPDLVEPLGIRRVLFCDPVMDEALNHPESAAACLRDFLLARDVTVAPLHPGESIPLGNATIAVAAVSAGPGRPSPVLGLIRDTAPRVLLAGDLTSAQLDLALARPESAGIAVVEAGPGARTVPHTAATILWRAERDAAEADRILPTAQRSAWARIEPSGAATSGRHER